MKIFKNLDTNDLENEIWKDILDYNGDYQVSSLGRVKSLKFGKERILKQSKNSMGYFRINICKNGKEKSKLVHRLVYEAHIGKLEDGYDAHHINEDEEDNFVDNLESKPHSKHTKEHREGMESPMSGKNHSKETKRRISKNNPLRLSNQKYINIKVDIEKEDLTQIEMAKKYGVAHSTISRIKNNKILI